MSCATHTLSTPVFIVSAIQPFSPNQLMSGYKIEDRFIPSKRAFLVSDLNKPHFYPLPWRTSVSSQSCLPGWELGVGSGEWRVVGNQCQLTELLSFGVVPWCSVCNGHICGHCSSNETLYTRISRTRPERACLWTSQKEPDCGLPKKILTELSKKSLTVSQYWYVSDFEAVVLNVVGHEIDLMDCRFTKQAKNNKTTVENRVSYITWYVVPVRNILMKMNMLLTYYPSCGNLVGRPPPHHLNRIS